jgi:hypothetical protein
MKLYAILFIATQVHAQTASWDQVKPKVTYTLTCFSKGKEVFKGTGLVSFPPSGGAKIKEANGNEILIKSADECNVKR